MHWCEAHQTLWQLVKNGAPNDSVWRGANLAMFDGAELGKPSSPTPATLRPLSSHMRKTFFHEAILVSKGIRVKWRPVRTKINWLRDGFEPPTLTFINGLAFRPSLPRECPRPPSLYSGMRSFRSCSILVAALAWSAVVHAQKFTVRFPTTRSATPLDGRLLLLLSTDPAAEPRMAYGVTLSSIVCPEGSSPT